MSAKHHSPRNPLKRFQNYSKAQKRKLKEFAIATVLAFGGAACVRPGEAIDFLMFGAGVLAFVEYYLMHVMDAQNEREAQHAASIAEARAWFSRKLLEIETKLFAHLQQQEAERIQKTGRALKHIGGMREALAWFRSNADGVIAAWNMVYRSNEALYRSLRDDYEKFLEKIRDLLKAENGCMWHDIFVFPPNGDAVPPDSFYEMLSPEERSGYEAKQIEVAVTLIQITVLKFKDGRCAVCLGYDFVGCKDPQAYVSFHPDNVRFFEDWLVGLYNDPRAARPSASAERAPGRTPVAKGRLKLILVPISMPKQIRQPRCDHGRPLRSRPAATLSAARALRNFFLKAMQEIRRALRVRRRREDRALVAFQDFEPRREIGRMVLAWRGCKSEIGA